MHDGVATKKQYLMTTGVALRAKVSKETVLFWVRIGKLSPIRTASGVRLFDPDEVDRFIRERGEKRSA